ncbi:oligosaccharide flippase family protein [Sporomusa aerivorans]|uniref:lipopolysaccharide biosynthesis protein n=1 Tax=Sporomusa aerivorans TaxID=204936 RepID=UPI00352AEE76
MSRFKTLLSDTAIYAAGEFGVRLITFLLVPFYTYVLTPAEYGAMDVILTLSQLVTIVISLDISYGVFRFLLESTEAETEDILSTTIVFLTIVTGIIVTLSIITLMYSGIVINYIYLIIIFYFVTIWNGFFNQVARGLNKIKIFIISGVACSFFIGVLNVVLIGYFKMSYDGMLVANTIALLIGTGIVVATGGIYRYIIMAHKRFNKHTLLMLLKYTIPVTASGVCWWGMTLSDRFFMQHFLGLDDVGIYAVAFRIASILIIINTIFDKAWKAVAIKEFSSETSLEFYSKVFNNLMRLQLLVILLLTICLKYVIPHFIGGDFSIAWKYVGPLLISAMFWGFSVFLGTGYDCTKKMGGAFYTTLISAISSMALNIILIPQFGIYGAVASSLIAYIILFAIRLRSTRHYFGIKIDYALLSGGLLLIITAYFISIYLAGYLACLINISLLLLYLFINRTFIFEMQRRIKFNA